MIIREVKEIHSELVEQLVHIWRASVTETHDFLSEKEIAEIEKFVPQALTEIAHLIIIENPDNQVLAFMGVAEKKLEMLFVAPQVRGQGIGKQLLTYGLDELDVIELTVNEQNPQAIGFYEKLGFEEYKRTATDEQGLSYPLLYMKKV